jgi:hypothetical protein
MAKTIAFARRFAAAATTALLAFASAPACAQAALQPVTITGKAPVAASVAGWDDVALERAPLQATTVDAERLRDAGAKRLADLVRFDPAVNAAYDTEGYIDYFTVRGFVIDNRFNYRRDGLPINAETSIPLENKARVDVLKGLSGMQAGTSAPGGLVDVIVKRPLDAPLRSAFVEWRERGSVAASVDLSQRFGIDGAFGVRLNAGAEHLDPQVRNTTGNRNVIALAGDWRASATTLVEAEVEHSHRSQPSVPGFSLLGEAVPAVPDPRLSLNNQPWSLPNVFDATTASLRLTQKLAPDWRLVVQGLAQRLRTDDRIAFPFGCGTDSAGPGGTTYFDRFCANGNFDLYDFRSENEHRDSSTLDVSLHGTATTGAAAHAISARHPAHHRSQPFPAVGVQLRRHRQHRRHARRAAGARRDDAEHQPRRAFDRARAARRDRVRQLGCDALARRAPHPAHAQRDADRRLAGHLVQPVVHDALRRVQPGARPRPARLRELGQGRRERRRAGRSARRERHAAGAALHQRRPGAARGREPPGRARHQGRRAARRVERRRVRHPPSALRRHRHVRSRAMHARARRRAAAPRR